MQDDMRMMLPASEPEPRAERAEVRVMLWDDKPEGGRGRCYLSFYPEPGKVLEIRPADYVPETAAAASATLIAKIDALTERLPHTDAHTVRVVSPAEIDRDCDRDTETWFLDPSYQGHAAPFAMGDAVTDSSAYHGLHQVLSVGQRYGDRKIELRLKRHPGFVFDKDAF